MPEKSAAARYTAEFIGTFLLIFTIGCNVITGQPVWGGVSIACVLTVMIYALGPSSGGNFNPAVSLALGMCEMMEWGEVAIYMVVQVLAGVAAAFAYVGMFGMHESFNLEPAKGHTAWQACLVEMIYTFMLCFVVLNVAGSTKNGCGTGNNFFGLAIGFVVVAGAYGAGAVSMGCFNPAVALAIDTASFWIGFKFGPIYAMFEFFGAALAAILFKVCRPEESTRTADGKADLTTCEWEKDDDGKDTVYPLSSRLLSEFLGTYMLVLTVGLNVLSASAAGAFSIAAALMSMIFALGDVSGAHFNPAVTVAIVVRGKCKADEAFKYIAVQIVGGIAAAYTYAAVMNGRSFSLKPDNSYTWFQAMIAEFAFTFVLAFVVLSVATTKKSLTHYFGFAIGMCVTVGGCAIGKVSGGSLNPAVSIGISMSHLIGGGGGWPCIVYTIVELVAGVFAAVMFKMTQPSEFATAEETEPLQPSVKKTVSGKSNV